MNLIEAIKSGRPFRRKSYGWTNKAWLISSGSSFRLVDGEMWVSDHLLTPADVIADDFGIEEPSVTLTRSSFWEAAGRTKMTVRNMTGYEQVPLLEYYKKSPSGLHDSEVFKLAQELGLEPKP